MREEGSKDQTDQFGYIILPHGKDSGNKSYKMLENKQDGSYIIVPIKEGTEENYPYGNSWLPFGKEEQTTLRGSKPKTSIK